MTLLTTLTQLTLGHLLAGDMSEVACFFCERVPRIRRYLRRFVMGDSQCPSHPSRGCHNKVFLDDIDYPDAVIRVFEHPRDDPRWPKQCVCGHTFQASDYWQVFSDWLFKRVDTGEVLTTEAMPPGAIYRAHWHEDFSDWRGPDSFSLICRLPNGLDWFIDGPANNGPGWDRTGVVPRLTCSPSILAGDYHGYLTDGVLRSC